LGGILSEFILGTLSTPVVPGQGISVVDFGWDFSRDIVNLIFIVVIVFIGLATILRLQSYQLQRTLPALVIVALLVNFSAVFVGFIVDISNLVIGVFIDEFAGFSVANLKAFVWDGPTNYLTNSFDQLFTEWSGGILGALGTIVGAVLYGIVLLLFNIIGALILFVVFLLFLARVIILWVLAILAPLAFGAYILPATRRFWDQWLQQLVQWSIIGVPLGLFLVLAKQVFDNPVASIIPGLSSDPSISADAIVGTMNSFIAQAFSPMVGLALMLVGVMLSMQMAPAGAAKIISLGKKWGVAAGLATGSGLWRRFEGKDIRQGGGRVSRFGAALSERAKTL
ncbi:MAG: hypothetical protein Q8P12_02830, partial [bacterium]|nr:hypothetical protein [bacterium]